MVFLAKEKVGSPSGAELLLVTYSERWNPVSLKRLLVKCGIAVCGMRKVKCGMECEENYCGTAECGKLPSWRSDAFSGTIAVKRETVYPRNIDISRNYLPTAICRCRVRSAISLHNAGTKTLTSIHFKVQTLHRRRHVHTAQRICNQNL